MEWTKIEEKWHDMASRLQAANRVTGPRTPKGPMADMAAESVEAEPLDSTGNQPSGDLSALVVRELT